MGDVIFSEGNLIFTGVVVSLEVEKLPHEESCLQIEFKPIEVIFGKITDNIAFGICGPSEQLETNSEEYSSMVENLGWEVGSTTLIGVTKKDTAKENNRFKFKNYRLLHALCYPLSIRLDQADSTQRSEILENFRLEAKKANKF